MTDAPMIFVSHSDPDSWVARKMAEDIRNCGARTFFAKDEGRVRGNFETEISTAIREARELVAYLSSHTRPGEYVVAEIATARAHGKDVYLFVGGLTRKELGGLELPPFVDRGNVRELNDFSVYIRELRAELERT